MRLDLSFNHLFGSIPSKLVQVSLLTVLDLRNNSLSGNVPSGEPHVIKPFQFLSCLFQVERLYFDILKDYFDGSRVPSRRMGY